MLRVTPFALKNPVIPGFGKGKFTNQFKRILQKEHLHFYKWTPLTTYDPRPLWHTDREVDHITGQEKASKTWDEDVHWVPDQTYQKVPVPSAYKDAYWVRDAEARRVQCPVDWVFTKYASKNGKHRYDLQDLSFKEKKFFSHHEVVDYARTQRR